jgi:hypothetical protein
MRRHFIVLMGILLLIGAMRTVCAAEGFGKPTVKLTIEPNRVEVGGTVNIYVELSDGYYGCRTPITLSVIAGDGAPADGVRLEKTVAFHGDTVLATLDAAGHYAISGIAPFHRRGSADLGSPDEDAPEFEVSAELVSRKDGKRDIWLLLDLLGDGSIVEKAQARAWGANVVYKVVPTPADAIQPDKSWVVSEKLTITKFEIKGDVPDLIKAAVRRAVDKSIAELEKNTMHLGEGQLPKDQFDDILAVIMPIAIKEWVIEVKQEIFVDTPAGRKRLRTNLLKWEQKAGEAEPKLTITEQPK